MRQNLAVAYNAVAVPIGIVGLASLLIGALAKSGASLLVTLNAWDHGSGSLSCDPRPHARITGACRLPVIATDTSVL
jgi:hypothetical protein